METHRPQLVMLSPVWPAPAGNGLAMRAGLFLDALAGSFEVHVIVVPVFGEATATPDFVRERAARAAIVDLAPGLDPLYALCAAVGDPQARAAALADYPRPELCRFATSATLARLQALAPAGPLARLVVLRSYLAPYAQPFLAAEGTVLDLDDDEADTRRRLAALHLRLGQAGEAAAAQREAAKYLALEAAWLPRFGVLLTCAERHRAALAARLPGARVEVVPNGVAMPSSQEPPAAGGAHPRLLLVGNLSYLPNVDAALWLCQEILPVLRRRDGATEVRLAGSRPAETVRRLATLPGVTVYADPVDLAPHYAWASAAIVPLRAGGGTRIKILEAFAAGVPVLATPVGAEGIDAADGRELLLGDGPEELAAACLRLHGDPELRRRLVEAAGALVRERYSHAVVGRRVREVVG